MEDAVVDGLSDRGSTPLRSTILRVSELSGNAVFMRVSALSLFMCNCCFEAFLIVDMKKSGV